MVAAPDPDRPFAYGHVVRTPRLAQLPLELGPPFDRNALGFVPGEPVEREQVRQVAVADRRALLDDPLHHPLGERWLVALVMTATAGAVQVHEDVAAGTLPGIPRQPGHLAHGITSLAAVGGDRDLE